MAFQTWVEWMSGGGHGSSEREAILGVAEGRFIVMTSWGILWWQTTVDGNFRRASQRSCDGATEGGRKAN
jgi:hypothetical protein